MRDWSQIAPLLKKFLQKESFSDFIATFAMSYQSFACFFICNTKIGENLTWQNPGPLGFAACHKQELFVAQELINKVKSKCCGIKDYEETIIFYFVNDDMFVSIFL